MAEYQGKKVTLDDPFRLPSGSKKKFGVYVKNPSSGNVIMVKFGDPNLSIKRDDPERLKNFRARHNCADKKDKTTPGYWSCKFWEKNKPVSKLLKKGKVTEAHCESEAMYLNLPANQRGMKQARISTKGVFGYKNAVEEAKRIKKLYPKKDVSIMQHAKEGNFKFATDSIGIRRLEKQGYEVVEVLREGWSEKYKDSIDCDNPKGFSQKAHCDGKEKRAEEEQECNCGCDDCMNEEAYLPGQATTSHGGKSGRGGKPGPRMNRQRRHREEVLMHLVTNGIKVTNQPSMVTQKGSSDTFAVAKNQVKKAEKMLDDFFKKAYIKKSGMRRDAYTIIAEGVNEVYKDSGLGDWFGKGGGGGKEEGGWDRFNASGDRIGKCGDAKEGDAYSACLSAEKAKQLGKEGRAEFVRRKRDAQKKAGDKAKGGESKKGQKPVMVKTGAKGLDKKNESMMSFGKFLREGENKPNNPALWKKAIAKAKAKFDVYPSAYANAWASKWYKGEGGTWSKK